MLNCNSPRYVVWSTLFFMTATPVMAAKNDWAEGTPGRSTGATRDYYNAAGNLAWKNFMGDWRDSRDVAQGDIAYATAEVEDDDKGRFVEWEVTKLVHEWQQGKHQNQGFFLRTTSGGGTLSLVSILFDLAPQQK